MGSEYDEWVWGLIAIGGNSEVIYRFDADAERVHFGSRFLHRLIRYCLFFRGIDEASVTGAGEPLLRNSNPKTKSGR